jgi:hypothetical protein
VQLAVAIGVKRRVVTKAAHHVRPMAGHDLAVSGFLEIKGVERLSRTGNDVGGLRGVLREDPSFEKGHDFSERSNIGAWGQKFQKFTTGLGAELGCRMMIAYGSAGSPF